MNITTSLEVSKRLKESGYKQESVFYWTRLSDTPDGREDWVLKDFKFSDPIYECSAPTTSELLEKMPANITIDGRLRWLIIKKEFLMNDLKTPIYTCEYNNSDNEDVGHTTSSTPPRRPRRTLHTSY